MWMGTQDLKIIHLYKCKNIYKLAFTLVLYFPITNIKHYLHGYGYKPEFICFCGSSYDSINIFHSN